MIAEKAKIDISTLHYHWGDKRDLFEAVLMDINRDLGRELIEVEKKIHGRPLGGRIKIAIAAMTDYLFVHAEISNLVLHRYFSRFFQCCDGLHKPGGLLVIQVITIPDQRYKEYRQQRNWIQKYIFPGGLLSSVTVLSGAAAKLTR